MSQKSKSIETIQAQRGLAAIYVALYHVYIIFMEPQYGSQVVFKEISRHGFLGVAYFFVLSGFIISLAHARDIGSTSSLLPYVRKRFERVYPAYWVYLTGFILASAIGLGYPDFSWSPLNLFSSYVLLPLNSDLTLPIKVAWTLVHEVMFYLLFAVFFINVRLGYIVFAAWFVALGLNFFLKFSPDSYFLSEWNLYFIGGIAAFLIYRRLPARYGLAVLLAGIALLAAYVLLSSNVGRIRDLSAAQNHNLHLLLIPAFLLIVAGTALHEQHSRLSVPLLFRFLGDASYSIYLVHSAVISVMAIIGKKLGLFGMLGYEAFFVVCFVGSVVGGSLAYLLVEKPIMLFFRRRRAAAAVTPGRA
ncbi:acyltransferase family protein [Microvirga tunisiensis]|uniref:Acyltransferase family protein n=1 Tax=Pannonibacter tanglangensis TaxID=2750084 RepID=A0A7X5F1I8_9HYPH|nr:acyltransferase [Pannonibacter sp. XCT-53]NBN78056.1 acyltransferase family protein [Pannonibacter sp. XCT-53]